MHVSIRDLRQIISGQIKEIFGRSLNDYQMGPNGRKSRDNIYNNPTHLGLDEPGEFQDNYDERHDDPEDIWPMR